MSDIDIKLEIPVLIKPEIEELKTIATDIALVYGPDGNGNVVARAESGGGDGHIIQDEGVPLPVQPVLDFQGDGVEATNGSGKTIITIPGGGGLSDFFSASNSAGQTILATPDPTLLVFDDESYSNPNYSSSVFTVSAAGSYEFLSTIAIVSLSEDAVLQLFLVKNTAEVIKAEKFDLIGVIEGRSISLHLLNVQLALNDTIQMIAIWSGSQTISMIPAGGGGDNVFNWFEGRKI